MGLESQIEIVIIVCTLDNFICLQERGIQMSPNPLCTDQRPFVALFDQDAKDAMKEIRNQMATAMWERCPT